MVEGKGVSVKSPGIWTGEATRDNNSAKKVRWKTCWSSFSVAIYVRNLSGPIYHIDSHIGISI